MTEVGPPSWTLTTLGELCAKSGGSVQTGPFGSQLHASDYVIDGIPSVMPQNIGDNVISELDIARIRESDALRLAKYRLRPGDIVYSRRGDVEKRALVRDHQDGWLCGTGCLRVRFEDGATDAAFISYLLGTEDARAWIVRHAVGATMPNLNTSILSSVPLRVPVLSKQRAIAEVLGALDDKIAANRRASGLAAELARVHFDAVRATDGYVVSIREIAVLITRGIAPQYTDGDGLIVLNQKCIRGQSVSLESSRITAHGRVRGEKCLRRNDVLVNSTGYGTLGRTARWIRPEDATVDSHLSIVRFDGALVDPVVAGYAVLGQEAHIEGLAEGSTGQTELSRSQLGWVPLNLPPRAAQLNLSALLDGIDQTRVALDVENRSLATLRDTLLPQLMSRKLRVKDAEKQLEDVV